MTLGCIKRCSRIRKCLTKVVDFVSKICSGFTVSTEVDVKVTLNGNRKVAKFSYLRYVLRSGRGVQEAVVTARI